MALCECGFFCLNSPGMGFVTFNATSKQGKHNLKCKSTIGAPPPIGYIF